jgi:pyrroline-5-carboxylate reductase
MALNGKLGFLGFGNMGNAIAKGLIDKGIVEAASIAVYDVSAAKQQDAEALGISVVHCPGDLLDQANIIILAVKPQNMASALEHFEKSQEANTLFISIAAGITVDYISSRIGAEARVARVMPNTPCLVGYGAAGIALGPHCTEDDGEAARTIFEAVGVAVMVSEQQIDVVTALSGSGPAYFFYMVESMVQGAVAQGLSEKDATILATQTLLGAGQLLAESDESAAVLRERVTSKGGTTEAALRAMEGGAYASLMHEAIEAAVDRARQMAKC